MKPIIYKIDIPECSNYTYEVGEKGVIKIEQEIIQIGTAERLDPSKMIYRVIFENGNSIEISANVSGIVLFKREYADK